MIKRMIAAAQLKAWVYEEVEQDTTATGQSMAIVFLAAVGTGVAVLGLGEITFIGFISSLVLALIGWAMLAGITYLVGSRLFRTQQTHVSWGELARTLGFAQAPGVLRLFAIIPGIGPYIFIAVSIWVLIATVTAIKHALDYTSTLRAIGVAIVSFIPYALLMSLLADITPGV